MNKGIRKLLHDKKKIPVETIQKCISIYADKYNLKEILLSNRLQVKEAKHLEKFGRNTPQFLHEVNNHIERNFDMFLSVVTAETGVTFRYNKKKKEMWHDEVGMDKDTSWSYLAYNNVTDDF